MIIDKEYPATHSMATSWFAIDNDGNVAIIEFDDNGPVPDNVRIDFPPSDVVTEVIATPGEPFWSLNLTADQACEIINGLMVSDKGEITSYSSFVQIDTNHRTEFEEIARRQSLPAYSHNIIVNKETGLYLVPLSDWKQSELDKLIDQKIILKIGNFDIYTSVDRDDKMQKWDCWADCSNMPYFIYSQPYDSSCMIQRCYVPKYPFKADRLPEIIKEKAVNLDIDFSDSNQFQISVLTPSRTEWDIYINSCDGESLTLHWSEISEDEMALVEMNHKPTFATNICGVTCNLCGWHEDDYRQDHINILINKSTTQKPTLTFIQYPFVDDIHYGDLKPLHDYIITIPLISGYPMPEKPSTTKRGKQLKKNIQVNLQEKDIIKIFENCYINLNKSVSKIRPYAIILSEKAHQVMKQHFCFSDTTVIIDEYEYPYFHLEDVEANISQLEKFAKQPYRGDKPSFIVSTKKRKTGVI